MNKVAQKASVKWRQQIDLPWFLFDYMHCRPTLFRKMSLVTPDNIKIFRGGVRNRVIVCRPTDGGAGSMNDSRHRKLNVFIRCHSLVRSGVVAGGGDVIGRCPDARRINSRLTQTSFQI